MYALEKEMATHFSTLARKYHGWGSLVGCSPWGHEESDTASLYFQKYVYTYTCI